MCTRSPPQGLCKERAVKNDLCLDNLAPIQISSMDGGADVRQQRVMSQHKMADTRCLGNPKANSDVISSLAVLDRMPFLCDSV